MNETKCPKLLPPCYTTKGKWYDIEHRCYVDPPEQPVYVRINGRKREAIRWLWLWRIVAWYQKHFMPRSIRLWLLSNLFKHKIGALPAHNHLIYIPRRND